MNRGREFEGPEDYPSDNENNEEESKSDESDEEEDTEKMEDVPMASPVLDGLSSRVG